MIAETKEVEVLESVTILRLKVDPKSDCVEALDRISRVCRMARNVGIEDWLLRQRGKPESYKQSHRLVRLKTKDSTQSKSESTKIYHAMMEGVEGLGSMPASMMAKRLSSHLNAKVDWRKGTDETGRRPRRKHEILSYESRPPFFSGNEIPLHNSYVSVITGESGWAVSCRGLTPDGTLFVPLKLKGLPAFKKKILCELSQGKRKLSDSFFVYRKDAWFWHLPVTFERLIRSDINAVLWPTFAFNDAQREKLKGQADRPFVFVMPGGIEWYIGDGYYLLGQSIRFTGLRKTQSYRYKQRLGGTGHGRQKIDNLNRRRYEQMRVIVGEVRRRAIADVVRQCVCNNVGVLTYREPSLPVREKCWFALNGLDWDWTRFGDDLKNAAARKGIKVVFQALKMKEARGDVKKKKAGTKKKAAVRVLRSGGKSA